jgi:lipopolysaccharide transport system ATP-binding protein
MQNRIEAEGVAKRYTLRHAGASHRYGSLREALTGTLKRYGRTLRGERSSATREDFWALRDVSFSLGEGDRLGIIGRNGAGKSTLLKILARVTDPSAGRIRMRGRVASLLEVGTGFHPELTGRENIFLNGALLGMRRAEVVSQFDAIVDFAEIERFLDTPVKRYSSGMYMRLAFAVAAHLQPEILIVDEVLAVGDSKFQRKCLGKMQEVGRGGRTVLFVSHNVGALRQLCNLAMVLDAGRCLGVMPCEEAVALYQTRQREEKRMSLGGEPLLLDDIHLNLQADGREREVFTGDPLRIGFHYACTTEGQDLMVCVSIKALLNETFMLFSHNQLEETSHRAGRTGSGEVEFPALPLSPGRYAVDMQGWLDGIQVIRETRVFEFEIHPVPSFASQTLHATFAAQLMPTARWRFQAG